MKVKIFSGSNVCCVEKCVNNFIKDKFVCKIMQSESCCKGCPNITITIIYDDIYHCEYLKAAFHKLAKS